MATNEKALAPKRKPETMSRHNTSGNRADRSGSGRRTKLEGQRKILEIWQQHEAIVRHLRTTRAWFETLSRGEIDHESRVIINNGYPPEFPDEIMLHFGKVASAQASQPVNPLRHSLHAHVVNLIRDTIWYFKQPVNNLAGPRELGRTDEEIIERAAATAQQLAEIDKEDLIAEASAACDTLNEWAETGMLEFKPGLQTKGSTLKKQSLPGSADEKIKAALQRHHGYRDRGCDNFEPIRGNELARMAEVSVGSVTNFWGRHFGARHENGTIADYRRACTNESISYKIAVWSGDIGVEDVLQLREDSAVTAPRSKGDFASY